MKVAIIDYGMGNVASVKKALDFLNISNVITADHELIKQADAILLPGVGSFQQGMKNLEERGLTELLTEEVIGKKKKFMGICLGMQLVLQTGTEPEECKGLGWIAGTVKKIGPTRLRVPHMGWNTISVNNPAYLPESNGKDFYFIHSYHAAVDDRAVIAAEVPYDQPLVAAIAKDNIFATQFHPEKSQAAGLAILKSYFTYA